MGQDQKDDEGTAAFVARRQREAAGRSSARATAHQAYGRQIRNGQDLDLQQPGDLTGYGSQPSPSPNPSSKIGTGTAPAWTAPEPLLQVDTAIRSAANTATFGGADRFAAAADALLAPGGVNGWEQRYNANLQLEQVRNQYDATHRRSAQSIGSVGGGLLALLAFGPEEAVVAAPRLAGAAKLTVKEAGSLLAAGGAGGVGVQSLGDFATGHRSSPGDLAGAAAGGMAGVVAFPLGPTRAGAIDGAVTSAAQDVFNGRPISVPNLTQSAYGGGLLGGHLGAAGREITDGLSIGDKGRLGGLLGDARERLNGGKRMRPNQRAPVTPGQTKTNKKRSYWYPDATDGPIPDDWTQPMPKMFEDKFGYAPNTSFNQRLAQANFGEKFQLNHFTPDDVALMMGLPAADFGPQIVDQAQYHN